jgi:tetratricopeptide (TPR) repeat protein
MKTSVLANVSLARIRLDNSRPLQALPLLTLAIQLDKKSVQAHLTLADAYHSLSRWPAALRTIDAAIALDENNATAFYERARILARLNRIREALGALKQSIELDSDRLILITDEKDFRPLGRLAVFKEMMAEAEKAKKTSEKPSTPPQP